TTYEGIAGKGSAVRAIFEAAHLLGAKACAMVDSDIRSIQPWWVERILGPVQARKFDYVTPYYVRHKYDGTITNNIAYPMTRALYGLRVRQPIGGDFGFSGALAEHYLHKPVWESDVARFGIDIWMTTTAINDGYRVAQAYLGAKIHDAKDPAASLGPMFRQVVGTLFSLLAVYPAKWRHVKGSQPTPMIGEPVPGEPDPIPISRDALVERFREGFRKLGPLWQKVVGTDIYAQLAHAAMEVGPSIELGEDLWAKMVYDFAVGFHREDLDPDEVVGALVPIYFGRIAAFAAETDSKTTAQAEEVIERQARVFEELKPRLIQAWDRG
ncbi:MAG: glycosyl transferase family 2, partial [Armatimonadota bacterium]|nr:glycosyl transferase family 2 [Armatimonadota bacterium]